MHPSSPLSPWIDSAVVNFLVIGFSLPLNTLIPSHPPIFNIFNALFVTFSRVLLPNTVDMPAKKDQKVRKTFDYCVLIIHLELEQQV